MPLFSVVLDKDTSDKKIGEWLDRTYQKKLEQDTSSRASREMLAAGIAIGLKTVYDDRSGNGRLFLHPLVDYVNDDYVDKMHNIVMGAKREADLSVFATDLLDGIGKECYHEAAKIGEGVYKKFSEVKSKLDEDIDKHCGEVEAIILDFKKTYKIDVDLITKDIAKKAYKEACEEFTNEWDKRMLKAVTKSLTDPEVIKSIAAGLREFSTT